MAFPDEKTEHFLQGTIEALNYYNGVPKILKPDNTKAASIRNTKDELILNKAYEDLQKFYGAVIVPAPPLKPRGKATVENSVRWLETHLLEHGGNLLLDLLLKLLELLDRFVVGGGRCLNLLNSGIELGLRLLGDAIGGGGESERRDRERYGDGRTSKRACGATSDHANDGTMCIMHRMSLTVRLPETQG